MVSSSSKEGAIMRFISSFFLLIFIAVALFAIWIKYPSIKDKTLDFLHTKRFKTLEVRYSAKSIMEAHRRELLKDSEHKFLEPTLIFHPYLLMEVKYSESLDKTGEGVILWSLVDGEKVINTKSWEKTHGFADCIKAGADRDDFKIINALAAKNGAMKREALSKYLNVEDDTLDSWLDTCRKKNLIVQNGNNYRLHFQKPKLQVRPKTNISQWLVTKEIKNVTKIPRRYRSSEIENTAKAAFGNDFTVRKKSEVFLPIYSIAVENPDGSKMTTYWNALNGKRLPRSYLLE